MIHTGSCYCGTIRFRITPPLGALVFCHCSQCRRAQAVACAANTPIPAEQFALLSGDDALLGYRCSAHKTRYFCANCGSAIYSRIDGSNTLRIRAGSLDSSDALAPAAHIFAASKAPWHDYTDSLPEYDGREPGRS